MTSLGKLLVVFSLVGFIPLVGAGVGSAQPLNEPAFAGPTGVVAAHGHLWVTNVADNTVTELDASSGSVLQVIGRSTQDFGTPESIAVDNGVVWVANVEGNAATELDESNGTLVRKDPFVGDTAPAGIATGRGGVWFANELHESFGDGDVLVNTNSLIELNDVTGATMQTIEGSATNGLNSVVSIVECGGSLWAANANSDSISQFSAASGAFVRVVTGEGIAEPTSVTCHASQLWVTNLSADRIVILRTSNGTLVRTIENNDVGGATGVAFSGSHAWITNPYENVVTEFDASSGRLIRRLASGADGFEAPTGITVSDGRVWVANQFGNTISELNEATGQILQVIHS